jgi:hypothetical protein
VESKTRVRLQRGPGSLTARGHLFVLVEKVIQLIYDQRKLLPGQFRAAPFLAERANLAVCVIVARQVPSPRDLKIFLVPCASRNHTVDAVDQIGNEKQADSVQTRGMTGSDLVCRVTVRGRRPRQRTTPTGN